MFVDFFIKRPVFATVCSLLICWRARCAFPRCPIAQYPATRAAAGRGQQLLYRRERAGRGNRVTTLLEQAINGAEGMRYMTSTSGNDGSSSINATFDLDRDPRHRRRGRAEPRRPARWAACPTRSRRPA